MAELHTQAEQTKGKLAHVEQEEEELKKKVANLEANLKNSALTRLQELQVPPRWRLPRPRHPRTCRLATRVSFRNVRYWFQTVF